MHIELIQNGLKIVEISNKMKNSKFIDSAESVKIILTNICHHLFIRFVFSNQNTARKVSVFGVFLVLILENTDQKNSEYGHFSRSGIGSIFVSHYWKAWLFSVILCQAEAYSEPCQTSKMERFPKVVNGF